MHEDHEIGEGVDVDVTDKLSIVRWNRWGFCTESSQFIETETECGLTDYTTLYRVSLD